MSLDKDHVEQMNKLDELIKTTKERKSAKFGELVVASLLGAITSWLFEKIYSTPITNVIDSWTRAFFFIILFLGIAAFLFVFANWTDILHDIRNRRKKPK